MTDPSGQTTPATVAAAPKQAGETTQRKLALSLGSSAVWTERMLDTLERGIEGGQWYSLIDKVWNEKHLLLAAWSVIRNDGAAGVDGQVKGRLGSVSFVVNEWSPTEASLLRCSEILNRKGTREQRRQEATPVSRITARV